MSPTIVLLCILAGIFIVIFGKAIHWSLVSTLRTNTGFDALTVRAAAYAKIARRFNRRTPLLKREIDDLEAMRRQLDRRWTQGQSALVGKEFDTPKLVFQLSEASSRGMPEFRARIVNNDLAVDVARGRVQINPDEPWTLARDVLIYAADREDARAVVRRRFPPSQGYDMIDFMEVKPARVAAKRPEKPDAAGATT